jgi:hypothetical protein
MPPRSTTRRPERPPTGQATRGKRHEPPVRAPGDAGPDRDEAFGAPQEFADTAAAQLPADSLDPVDRQGLTAIDHLTGSLVLPAVVLLICSIVALLSGIVAVPLTPAALVRVTLMALGHVAVAVLLAALSFTRLPSTRLGEIPTPVTGAATALLLWLLADTPLPPGTDVVGSFWTRANDPEIDIIGGDRSPTATRITAVGSIKWHDKAPFDARDLARLTHHRDRLPGADPDTPCSPSAAPAARSTGCRSSPPPS